MQISNRHFIQSTLESLIEPGNLVLDGAAGIGINTRFFASRVGANGHVLSFNESKEDANKTASSLFMAGLQDRVDVINGAVTKDKLEAEIGRVTKVDVAILDYGSDTGTSLPTRETLNEQINLIWNQIKDDGLLIVNLTRNQQAANFDVSITDDTNKASYQTSSDLTYLLERKSEN
ncbi:SAM-dependent methyltransferase [Fructobacillus pseudoficulneus]|uniref:SAM-dependent methyltransferase n=1 Tax=Fructobacillus pseudoficulneus TaxID=220714 RepID=A0A3F3GVE3_9LACO|nr:hypothetical protein [Fructobacillus pseudoficulneus]GAP02287.1 SAM-dependent methyltransferase [Fructobacillus pseudoficulneus]SEH36287.1 hypothetical protein SAMN05660469_0239 [Fructobacillus pseudoficulneus]